MDYDAYFNFGNSVDYVAKAMESAWSYVTDPSDSDGKEVQSYTPSSGYSTKPATGFMATKFEGSNGSKSSFFSDVSTFFSKLFSSTPSEKSYTCGIYGGNWTGSKY